MKGTRTLPRFITTLSGVLVTLHLTACAANQTVSVTPAHQASQCGYIKAQAISLKGGDIEALKPDFMPSAATPIRQAFRSAVLEQPRAVRYLMLAQGHKPTPGYGFEWQGSSATLRDQKLELPLRFTSPPKDAMLAQVITSPCILISYPDDIQPKQIVIDDLTLEIE